MWLAQLARRCQLANSRLALLGSEEGPWIDISRVPNPALRVTGLPIGGSVKGHLKIGERNVEICLRENGILNFERGHWLKVRTDSPCRSLICEVINSRMVA